MRLISKSKSNKKDKTKVINKWAVAILRYDARMLKWIVDEPKQLGRRTWKLLKIHRGLYPKRDVDRLYVSRRQGDED